MSHTVVLVVTDSPDDLEDTLAPFDENMEVDPYPDEYGTVVDLAESARR